MLSSSAEGLHQCAVTWWVLRNCRNHRREITRPRHKQQAGQGGQFRNLLTHVLSCQFQRSLADCASYRQYMQYSTVMTSATFRICRYLRQKVLRTHSGCISLRAQGWVVLGAAGRNFFFIKPHNNNIDAINLVTKKTYLVVNKAFTCWFTIVEVGEKLVPFAADPTNKSL